MRVSDFTYELPEELIAQHPPTKRGTTRLLVLDKATGAISHKHYADLADYVQPGDVIVLNDTKVIKARLIAKNQKGQTRELLLLEDHNNTDFTRRKALYRGKLHPSEQLDISGIKITVEAVLEDGIAEISSNINLLDLADQNGSVPLPPYMKREATNADIERYQTVFAQTPGSVAAPTASLNFTHELERKLKAKGVHIFYITLHVGLGTFLPIRTDNIESHKMHSEYFEIRPESIKAIQEAKQNHKKVIAIGTTVARTLEYALPNNSHFTSLLQDSLVTDDQNVKNEILSGEADIFIYPGYQFEIVDALLTNFHAPKSTVLMLATAFAGWENLLSAYEEAIKQKYALLSYGDSMLII